MLQKTRKSLFLTCLSAALLASVASAAIASAAESGGEDGDDDNSSKTAGCALIGCANGARLCGTATGTIKAGVPPFVGEVSVSYTCYEAAYA